MEDIYETNEEANVTNKVANKELLQERTNEQTISKIWVSGIIVLSSTDPPTQHRCSQIYR